MVNYSYKPSDQQLLQERVDQYREQVAVYMSGGLTEDQFRPLRLMNGLYVQAHAPMLRIAIPYGVLESYQLRGLADIADKFDRGWGHFTTRQNIQFNWIKLDESPDVLQALADIQMHAIQTSGNCIRNISIDQLAGVSPDEIEDPRVISELLRQWSTFHPEFSFLPRKFKIAIGGSRIDRAATKFHDIGLHIKRNDQGETCVDFLAGGGLGRTPVIGKTIRSNVPIQDHLRYATAILRIYNLYGRRDNKFKARIKILVNAIGVEEFRKKVDAEFEIIKQQMPGVEPQQINALRSEFAPPAYEQMKDIPRAELEQLVPADWLKRNTAQHKVTGYIAVYLSLKSKSAPPGDLDSDQLRAIADIADAFSFGEIRTTHTQNLLLPYVRQDQIQQLYQALQPLDVVRPNIDAATDIICCPGLDYCGLANTDTINVTREIDTALDEMSRIDDVSDLKIKISGCMNACGHHHVGHIGILGVEKKGKEWYQLQLGGSEGADASLGKVIGPAVKKSQLATSIVNLVEIYLDHRKDEEQSFLEFVRHGGFEILKEGLYANLSE